MEENKKTSSNNNNIMTLAVVSLAFIAFGLFALGYAIGANNTAEYSQKVLNADTADQSLELVEVGMNNALENEKFFIIIATVLLSVGMLPILFIIISLLFKLVVLSAYRTIKDFERIDQTTK